MKRTEVGGAIVLSPGWSMYIGYGLPKERGESIYRPLEMAAEQSNQRIESEFRQPTEKDREMELQFNQKTQEEFEAYVDDIKQRLKKDAPEWHVHLQSVSYPEPCLYYHLARFDFSGGKDMTWSIPINTWVFGYEKKEGDDLKHFLLNIHPLENTKRDDGEQGK